MDTYFSSNNALLVQIGQKVKSRRTIRSLDLLEPFFREEEISPLAYAEALQKKATPKRVRNKNALKPSKPLSSW